MRTRPCRRELGTIAAGTIASWQEDDEVAGIGIRAEHLEHGAHLKVDGGWEEDNVRRRRGAG